MVEVTIAGDSIAADRVSEGWLNKMLVEARKHGGMPCVQVRIKESAVDMVLSTPGCGGAPGGRQAKREGARDPAGMGPTWSRRRTVLAGRIDGIPRGTATHALRRRPAGKSENTP